MADPFGDSLAGLGDVSAELERIGDLADGVGKALSRAFRGAVLDGKSLKSVLGEVARSFADIALKAAFQPIGSLVSGAIESLFTATNPSVTAFAKGGVLQSPTYFGLGQGLGLAGEAGAEAVLPLSRGSDGRLGVAGGGGAVNVTFNVTATDARSFFGERGGGKRDAAARGATGDAGELALRRERSFECVPLLRGEASVRQVVAGLPSRGLGVDDLKYPKPRAQDASKAACVAMSPDAEKLVRAEEPAKGHVAAEIGAEGCDAAEGLDHVFTCRRIGHGALPVTEDIYPGRSVRLFQRVDPFGDPPHEERRNDLPSHTLPPRHVARRAGRAGAGDRSRHFGVRTRGAQQPVAAFAAAVQCRVWGEIARRHGGGAGVFRGAAGAVPFVPVAGRA